MKIRILIVAFMAIGLLVAPAQAKKKNKHEQLPPGLAKNVERGKPLPPGWQKKLAKGKVMDRDIYERGSVVVPLDPLGIVTIRIEGKVFRVMEKNREIIDILRE
jgi:hypothetical protein